jgi:putative membrane protein
MAFDGTVPGWVVPHLDDAKIKSIEAAIVQAENKTSGEIVPLVVKSSSAIGHVPIITFSAVLIAMLVFQFDHFQKIHIYDTAYWSFVNVILAAVFSYIFSKFEFVQRLLVSEDDRIAQVKQRAELEFYRLGITETEGATGILIFVSLLEHRIEVMADKKISDLLPPETWDRVVEQVLTGIRSGDLAKGLCLAIDTCGTILADKFPINPGDRNELKNHIIFKL